MTLNSEQSNIAQVNEDSVQPEKRVRRSKKRRRRRSRIEKLLGKVNWRLVLVITGVMLVIVILGNLVLIVDSINRLEKSQDELDRVFSTLNNKPSDEWTYQDFERLQSSLDEVKSDLSATRQRTVLVRQFSSLNSDLDNTLIAIDASWEMTLALDSLLNGLQPTIYFVTEEQEDTTFAQVSSGERVVELLRLGRSNFIETNRHLENANTKLEILNSKDVESVDLFLAIEDLTTYYEDIQETNALLLDSPDLLTVALGLEDPQNYLVLSQNNDELRPSGGYISTYGWLTVSSARIANYDYYPTTENSPNPPSDQLASEISIPSWWIQYQDPIYTAWDASWYADFPSTAEQAMWYYNNGNNPQSPVDGVIAIDIVGLQYLVEGLGEVYVEGYEDPVTAANFRTVIYDIRASGEGELPHKQFLAKLYREVLTQWKNIPQENKDDIITAFLRGMREKHIIVYFTDERLNQAVHILGWGGNQEPAIDHDYIMVVDANFSANKSNSSILRQMIYDVEILDSGNLNSRLTINYDYPDVIAQNDPAVRPEHYNNINYYNVMQVFVPAGSSLNESDNFTTEVLTERGDETHTAFVSSLVVDYNTQERPQLTYSTPDLIEDLGEYKRYRLLIQKQPGTRKDEVSIQVRLPDGIEIISTSPEPVAQFELDQTTLEFRTSLERDQWIEIIYR